MVGTCQNLERQGSRAGEGERIFILLTNEATWILLHCYQESNMQEGALKQLAYLHDATVKEIRWKHVDGHKSASMTVTCDPECGRDDWAGQQVVVTFNDVLFQSSYLFGHVYGEDSFDRTSQDLSQDFLDTLQKLISSGMAPPKICLRIALHSGSDLQLACDRITIKVDSPGVGTHS